jgi:hypothetical protein
MEQADRIIFGFRFLLFGRRKSHTTWQLSHFGLITHWGRFYLM